MSYKKINLYLGWFVFLIATIVYFITIEDTVSLWDCGEYITAAYKLEVGHPPGAPLFMVLGRLFSFFAAEENVAVWINRLSALSSSLSILFMYWSLTMLIKKMVLKARSEISSGDKVAIFGAAFIGALAYTFSDSFWFSAVEGEVYAMSSLFTAIIFWAILKWDEEMMEVQNGQLVTTGYSPDRWILLIMFMLGLAIGVHLLGILVVPAIAYVMYFRHKKEVNLKGIIIVGILSVFILGFIQEGVIPGSIAIASAFEVSFVNSFGLPFYSGTIFFFILVVAFCVFMIRFARKRGNKIIYTATMSLILLLIGYGSFAVIVIRSNANTPLDENDPENLVTLHSYLKREQYGSAPILFGPQWNSKENDRQLWDDQGPLHLRRYVVVKNDKDVKAFRDEDRANAYSAKLQGSYVEEKYYESNASSRKNSVPTYSQAVFFPRMYWSAEPRRTAAYKAWSGYDAGDDSGTEIGSDGKRLPTFGENMRYFTNYQVNWMYWRYFMWNFAGRQNDIQGHGDAMRGNWLSGIRTIDEMRLGDQSENAPFFTSENRAYNKFFLLPLILGFIGLIFHFYRAPKDAFVVFLAFLFTGVAIVVYLNQKPFEPRERDYAFAGSFYFFALWIGIGTYALYDAFKSFGKKEFIRIAIIGGAGALILAIASGAVGVMTWFIMFGIAALVIAIMVGLRKVLKKDVQGAGLAVLLTIVVPLIMAFQGWDDHDRSLKTSAHDLALNYLNSCEQNGIIFTNGDNDTFPLWYMQEVEGKRTDVRVCNLSLMQTDWYTDQMKMKAYLSEPLPIKFTEDQIAMYSGATDHVLFSDLFDLFYVGADRKILKKIIKMRVSANPDKLDLAAARFNAQAGKLLEGATATDPRIRSNLASIKATLSAPLTENKEKEVFNKFQAAIEVFTAARGGLIQMDRNALVGLQEALTAFETEWNMTDLADAMEFVRDDENIVTFEGQRRLRVFPSSAFSLKVNKENAVKSGIVSPDQKNELHETIKFRFTQSGISREQVMMLDILANNEWKRPIYFSSPGGSEVALSLLRGMTGRDGYIKQNGMAFELSPSNNDEGSVNRDKMYEHLMKTYSYGAMNNEKVLTDYYARRHTSQYRSHFLQLARDLIGNAVQAEDEIKRAEMIREMNPEMEIPAPSMTEAEIKEFKKKGIELIKHSLKVMPPELVIDYGEPTENTDPRKDYELNGRSLKAWNDGTLHEYVRMLYLAGDKKGANELGLKVAEQLESIINYFEKSDVTIAAKQENTPDLYAAMENYFQIFIASIDEEYGDKNSELAKRTTAFIQHMEKEMFPSMVNRLKAVANENGESTRRSSRAGYYASMLFDLEDYRDAMFIEYGIKERPQVTTPPANQPTNGLPALPSPGM